MYQTVDLLNNSFSKMSWGSCYLRDLDLIYATYKPRINRRTIDKIRGVDFRKLAGLAQAGVRHTKIPDKNLIIALDSNVHHYELLSTNNDLPGSFCVPLRRKKQEDVQLPQNPQAASPLPLIITSLVEHPNRRSWSHNYEKVHTHKSTFLLLLP